MKIIIDSGGTKTKGALFDGVALKQEITTGPGNILVNFEKTLTNISYIIEKLINNKVNSIVIGIAGCLQAKSLVDSLKKSLKSQFKCKITIISDIELQLKAVFNNLENNNAILNLGTGTSFALIKNGQIIIKKGWGHLIGDPASGYYLGRELLELLATIEDSDSKNSLYKKFLKDNNISCIREIVNTVYTNDKSYIANFAKWVLANALEFKELMTIIDLGIGKLLKGLNTDNLNIFAVGSIAVKSPIIQGKLKKRVKNITFASSDYNSLKGGIV